ncbi:MAG: hypothetical protein Q8Q09_03630 [Deltaproteobacteria bacterium]|nr:hypothetical protein [Deltaproteobacteria bacterium]
MTRTNTRNFTGFLGLVSAVTLATATGCSTPPPPSEDAGTDSSVMGMDGTVENDGSTAPDATVETDGSTETDGGTGPEAGTDGGTPSGDWGFRPMPHGFSFENYTNMSMPMNLTSQEMRRLFGPTVCEGAAAAGACTLVPQAKTWMDRQNAGMNGGHCEGLAVLSSLMYTGASSPMMFGAATDAFSLMAMGNDALTRELALWFVTQGTIPGLERRDQTPNQIVERLTTELSRGRAFGGTVVGIYLRAGGGGHAITPMYIRRPSEGVAEIVVYDNNFPNTERVVTVNTVMNTWSYTASTNPMEPGALYDGDATTFNLTLADIAPRTMFPHACSFCGNVAMDGGGRASVQIALNGEGDLSISDGMGGTTGSNAAGAPVNSIPGANVARIRSGLFSDSPEPIYTVPRATPLTITLDGSRLSAATDSEILISGPGFSLGVDGISLDPMQRDTVIVQPGQPDITYRASGAETPTLSLALQTAADDFDIEVRSGAMAAGQNLRLAADLPMSRARISFAGSTSAPTFELYMERVTETGSAVFRHVGVTATATTVLYVNYATWAGNGMPLSVGVDLDGNGTIDRTDMLADQP